MVKHSRASAFGAMMFVAAAAVAQSDTPESSARKNSDVFYGGTLGLGFGDVDYIELAPLVGKHLSPQVSVGGSIIYRYRSDDRYEKDLSTNDYGASVFGRYHLTPRFFAHAEYEYLNYEYYKLNLDKERDTADSFFIGGGISAPAGRSSALYLTALYNVNYDDDESPYDSPWVVRFGVGVGF